MRILRGLLFYIATIEQLSADTLIWLRKIAQGVMKSKFYCVQKSFPVSTISA